MKKFMLSATSATSRRAFFGAADASFLRAAVTAPELILYNANIRTVDAANPHAQAVAIAGSRFVAVGSTADIRRLGSSCAKHVDLGGKTVVPGFIDAHVHVASSGLRHLQEVDCDLRFIAQIQTAIRKRASAVPAGECVVGFKYDDTKTSEGRPLTREDLDAAAPNHPVSINHRGGHISFVNSRALMAAGARQICSQLAKPRALEF